MDKKIIVFLEDDTADGGLGMVFRSLAKYLSQYYRVIYLSTRMCDGRIPKEIEYVRFCENGKFEAHTNGICRSLAGIRPLRSLLKQFNPCVAVSFGFYGNIRLCLSTIGLPIKVLVSERGNATRFIGLYRAMLVLLLGRSDKIIFQSKAAMRAYPTLLRKKGTIINNAIFKTDLPDSSACQWDNRIVSVGRIHPDKNFPLLIRAFGLIAEEFPETVLEIYGEEEPGSPEPYLQQLKDLAKNQGLSDRVHFMGQSSCIGQNLAGARLFVLASVLEGMPNALIEAMACGLPCITTDFLPMCADEIMIDGVDGIITTRDDLNAMAHNMRKLLLDDAMSRRIAINAVKIRERLSIDIIFKQWRQEFDELAEKRIIW